MLRQFIPTGNAAAAPLLLDAGYWPVQHYLRMRIELEDAPPPHADGATRAFDRDQDEIAVHALVQEGLGEVEGFIAEPLEVWRRQRIEKKRWDPALWLRARGRRGAGGVALGERWDGELGYVAQLAVAPRARGNGYGRTLLLSLFEAFRADGLRRAELSVHGANRGAARLYESVGMTASWEAPAVGEGTWQQVTPHASPSCARADGRLGLDTEFMPEGRYRPLLCLVQIAAGGEIAVLDPLRASTHAPLAEVLADPDVEIIVHAGRQDVAILRREWRPTSRTSSTRRSRRASRASPRRRATTACCTTCSRCGCPRRRASPAGTRAR